MASAVRPRCVPASLAFLILLLCYGLQSVLSFIPIAPGHVTVSRIKGPAAASTVLDADLISQPLVAAGTKGVAAGHGAQHRKVPEVLVPAGRREQFLAALQCGADAVFLGLKDFNARKRADNFDIDDMRELVPLAHHYGMQVLVTVNVVIKEAELTELVETLSALEALEVDAVIVQDQAVGAIARRFFPALRLHASTQMAVHNLAGVMKAASLGYRRVVLARELTAKEVKDIRAATPSDLVQLEAFVHGSLCYSYSGLCFFSGANDARSGNRGECAYTCRQPYQIKNEKGYGFLFSMLDLDTSHSLDLLADAGVDTLKIEGRKKDAQYVSSAVRLYRRRLDELFGRPTLRPEAPREAYRSASEALDLSESALREDLSLSFHRGTTTFHVRGRYAENVIDLDNAGHLGVLAGKIVSVAPDMRHIRVMTESPLERYDGVKVVPPMRAFHSSPQHGKHECPDADRGLMHRKYSNELPEFSVRGMKARKQKVYEVSAGHTVDLELPPKVVQKLRSGEVRIQPGDVLYKTRSNELKRRVEHWAVTPAEYKMKPWDVVGVEAILQPNVPSTGRLTLTASVTKLQEPLLCDSIDVPFVVAEKKDAAQLAQEITDVLGVYGELGVRAKAVELLGLPVEGEVVPFVPKKELKALKQRIVERLPEAMKALLDERKQAALEAIARQPQSQPPILRPIEWSDRRYAIKVDRVEYLWELEKYVSERGEAVKELFEEVVFEPKRMFLPETRGKDGVDMLMAFQERTGLPVRLALPTVVRAWDEQPLKAWVKEFVGQATAKGTKPRLEVGNVGAWGLLEMWGLTEEALDLTTDFTMCALNSRASEELSRMAATVVTLSVEDDRENLRQHLRHWAVPPERARPQAIIYKDVPLFMAEACSLTALHGGCPGSKTCGYRTLEIENEAGERFFVSHELCKSIVYAENPYSIVHLQRDLLGMGVGQLRLDFLTRKYEAEHMRRILDAALLRDSSDATPIPDTYTANFVTKLL